jgi:hypothetical protein
MNGAKTTEKIDMNKAEAKLYIREDLENYEEYEQLTSPEICDQSRWSTYYFQVIEQKPTSTLWEISWSRGSTEMQDNGIEDVEVHEVEAYQEMVTKYRAKTKG